MIASASLKGVGQLRTHAAHDAAHVWIEHHAKDLVKIEVVLGKTLHPWLVVVQSINIKNEYVNIRNFKECIDGDERPPRVARPCHHLEHPPGHLAEPHPPDRLQYHGLFGSDFDPDPDPDN